jgi:hypothetical protein
MHYAYHRQLAPVDGAPQCNTVITRLREEEILVGANASRTMERYPALCPMFEPALNWSSHWYDPYARPVLCDPSPGPTGQPRNVTLSQCNRVYGPDGLSNGVLSGWCNLSLVRCSLPPPSTHRCSSPHTACPAVDVQLEVQQLRVFHPSLAHLNRPCVEMMLGGHTARTLVAFHVHSR